MKFFNEFVFFSLLTFFCACKQNNLQLVKCSGYAQGTSYHISYINEGIHHNYQNEIDSILVKIDSSLSTYVAYSTISNINKDHLNVTNDSLFINMFHLSDSIYKRTNGYFDPTKT